MLHLLNPLLHCLLLRLLYFKKHLKTFLLRVMHLFSMLKRQSIRQTTDGHTVLKHRSKYLIHLNGFGVNLVKNGSHSGCQIVNPPGISDVSGTYLLFM